MEMNFKDVHVTIKIYPIKKRQKNMEHWFEGQEFKMLSVRITSDISQKRYNEVYQAMLKCGYPATDKLTFMKEVEILQQLEEQKMLNEMFTMTVCI